MTSRINEGHRLGATSQLDAASSNVGSPVQSADTNVFLWNGTRKRLGARSERIVPPFFDTRSWIEGLLIMKIAQVAPLAESVPPLSMERVVSWLTEELVATEVTLFASGDSKTEAKLIPAWPKALRLSKRFQDPHAGYAALLEAVAQRANQFDVIHCHSDWIHLPVLGRAGVPLVTTLHGRLDLPHVREVAAKFPQAAFVSISESQRAPLPHLNWLGTVHHGMPTDTLRFSPQSKGHLVFLGRIVPEKGPDVAVRWARDAGRSLSIAAKIPRAGSSFFKERVSPCLDDKIRFVGEVDEGGKQELLGSAAGMLFPIDWPEPFGLVMIEAMACGTPVIARPRGSVPEIIEDGVSGFLVESDAEAVAAISRLATLDRHRVREAFEQRFGVRRMTEQYVSLYRRAITRPGLPAGQKKGT
jgi:glycosyltransferase involved in cell wall biosynthesis